MLYLVGLGLHDPSDVTVKGLGIIKNAARVYLEAYTSILGVEKNELVKYICLWALEIAGRCFCSSTLQEKYYGREVILADRELVEQNSGNTVNY